MKELILATGNPHKAEEFAELFDSAILKINAAPEKLEVVEDGSTFNENALKKAEAYYNKFKKPVLSDDSGLVVQAIPDELGIYSARFGGEGLTDKDRALHLLEKMAEQTGEGRSAYFVCVLCFYFSPDEIFFFEGRVTGQIGAQYKGEHGFGYDPVFIPEKHDGEASMAELPEWKQLNSHRASACKKASSFFKSGQN